MRLTLINEQTYHNTVLNTGNAFAEFYWGGEKHAVNYMLSSKAYWDWWVNQLRITTIEFINKYGQCRWDDHKFYLEWEKALAPENIIAFPSQFVIDQLLSKVWGEACQEPVAVEQKSQKNEA